MTLPPMPSHRLSPLLTLRPAAQAAVLCVALAGCAGMQSYREGQSALADGKVVSGIGKLKDLTDWKQYGGAPLLGFDRLLIKAHGRSQAHAVQNAIKVATK